MYYTTPAGSLLNAPSTTPTTAPDYTDIIQANTPSKVVAIGQAPQLTSYHIKCSNIAEVKACQRAAAPLSYLIGQTVTIAQSDTATLAYNVGKSKPDMVHFAATLNTSTYCHTPRTAALLGTDCTGGVAYIDIATAPHILIGGTTGGGKSVLMHTIINSLLFRNTPNTIKFMMIDTKQTELVQYSSIPHMLCAPITTPAEAVDKLDGMCRLMDTRYNKFRQAGVNNIDDYNALHPDGVYPRIIIVVDELADLMLTSGKAVETPLVRLAQLGRAAGLHLIVATQNPIVKVVTGLLKANFPTRITLKCASQQESKNLFDKAGAEKLQGKGDALIRRPDSVDAVRFQSAYISPDDVSTVVDYWRRQAPPPLTPAKPKTRNRLFKFLWA